MVSLRLLPRLAALPRSAQPGSYSCWRSLSSKASSGSQDGESSKVKLSFGGLKARLDAKADRLDAAMQEQKEFFSQPGKRDVSFPYYTDVCVIGGGAIGSSVAYNLKAMHSRLNVVVVDRDMTFSKASTTLAVGGIRQQFSVPENIMMSQYGYDFIRNFKRNLAVGDTPPPDINFNPSGYVFAATEAGAENLRENYMMQRDFGVKLQLLGPEALKERFPWMNTDGIALASVGLQGEGWFDPWALLYGLRAKATSWGAQFVEGEAVGFETEYWDSMLLSEDHVTEFDKVKKVLVKVKTPSGETETRAIQAAYFILAAGAHSAELAFAASIGKGKGMTRHKLPIEPRKRYVYTIHAPDGPGLDCPLFVDPTGMYFRREGLGGVYLAGMSPAPEHEPDASDLDTVDFSFFDEQIWPLLAQRVPAFERLKVRSGWAGFYDYNTLDQNPIIGPHPYHANLIFAGGFSGHGLQHAPATGRAVSELIYHGEYKTLDLSRFAYNRVMLNVPLREVNVV